MLSIFRVVAFLCALLFSTFEVGLPARGADAAPLAVSTCDYTLKWNALEIAFHNTGTNDIRKVNFLVMSASGPIQAVEHDGDFKPGSDTSFRSYTDQERLHAQVSVQCVPTTITYDDGTTWQNHNVGPDLEHAIAQTPGSPIRIRDCRVMDGYNRIPVWHYTYVDRAELPATSVTIGLVESGALLAQKEDAGTFSPGTEIVRELYQNNAVPSDVLKQRCIVLSAKLADGTTWTNPSAPQSMQWPLIAPNTALAGGQITITSCDSGKAHYRNEGPLAVTAVDIALLEDGQIVRTLRDVHALASHGELTSRFFANNIIKIKNEACVPLRVQYADGTEWLNPALAR
jgi:hypothetical protein